jgi:BirA family biotin operon repressor/biotin-[acetyl-CoA-carboxylase] ligase
MITGRRFKRSIIIGSVCRWFGTYYRKFIKTGDLSLVKDEYNSYLIHRDKEVEVIRESGQYTAKSKGIDDNGELIIEKEGKMETIMSGEVSVRGVYGYV